MMARDLAISGAKGIAKLQSAIFTRQLQ